MPARRGNSQVGLFDSFRSNRPPWPAGVPEAWCSFLDTDDRGSSHGSGAFTSNGTSSVYEIAHPLNSSDAGHDIALAPGDAVGFFLFLRILAAGGQYPQAYGDTDLPGWRNYGRIVIRP